MGRRRLDNTTDAHLFAAFHAIQFHSRHDVKENKNDALAIAISPNHTALEIVTGSPSCAAYWLRKRFLIGPKQMSQESLYNFREGYSDNKSFFSLSPKSDRTSRQPTHNFQTTNDTLFDDEQDPLILCLTSEQWMRDIITCGVNQHKTLCNLADVHVLVLNTISCSVELLLPVPRNEIVQDAYGQDDYDAVLGLRFSHITELNEFVTACYLCNQNISIQHAYQQKHTTNESGFVYGHIQLWNTETQGKLTNRSLPCVTCIDQQEQCLHIWTSSSGCISPDDKILLSEEIVDEYSFRVHEDDKISITAAPTSWLQEVSNRYFTYHTVIALSKHHVPHMKSLHVKSSGPRPSVDIVQWSCLQQNANKFAQSAPLCCRLWFECYSTAYSFVSKIHTLCPTPYSPSNTPYSPSNSRTNTNLQLHAYDTHSSNFSSSSSSSVQQKYGKIPNATFATDKYRICMTTWCTNYAGPPSDNGLYDWLYEAKRNADLIVIALQDCPNIGHQNAWTKCLEEYLNACPVRPLVSSGVADMTNRRNMGTTPRTKNLNSGTLQSTNTSIQTKNEDSPLNWQYDTDSAQMEGGIAHQLRSLRGMHSAWRIPTMKEENQADFRTIRQIRFGSLLSLVFMRNSLVPELVSVSVDSIAVPHIKPTVSQKYNDPNLQRDLCAYQQRTPGAIGIGLRFMDDTSLAFINWQTGAVAGQRSVRYAEYVAILHGLVLSSCLPCLALFRDAYQYDGSNLSNDIDHVSTRGVTTVEMFDHVFWMGDFNARLWDSVSDQTMMPDQLKTNITQSSDQTKLYPTSTDTDGLLLKSYESTLLAAEKPNLSIYSPEKPSFMEYKKELLDSLHVEVLPPLGTSRRTRTQSSTTQTSSKNESNEDSFLVMIQTMTRHRHRNNAKSLHQTSPRRLLSTSKSPWNYEQSECDTSVIYTSTGLASWNVSISWNELQQFRNQTIYLTGTILPQLKDKTAQSVQQFLYESMQIPHAWLTSAFEHLLNWPQEVKSPFHLWLREIQYTRRQLLRRYSSNIRSLQDHDDLTKDLRDGNGNVAFAKFQEVTINFPPTFPTKNVSSSQLPKSVSETKSSFKSLSNPSQNVKLTDSKAQSHVPDRYPKDTFGFSSTSSFSESDSMGQQFIYSHANTFFTEAYGATNELYGYPDRILYYSQQICEPFIPSVYRPVMEIDARFRKAITLFGYISKPCGYHGCKSNSRTIQTSEPVQDSDLERDSSWSSLNTTRKTDITEITNNVISLFRQHGVKPDTLNFDSKYEHKNLLPLASQTSSIGISPSQLQVLANEQNQHDQSDKKSFLDADTYTSVIVSDIKIYLLRPSTTCLDVKHTGEPDLSQYLAKNNLNITTGTVEFDRAVQQSFATAIDVGVVASGTTDIATASRNVAAQYLSHAYVDSRTQAQLLQYRRGPQLQNRGSLSARLKSFLRLSSDVYHTSSIPDMLWAEKQLAGISQGLTKPALRIDFPSHKSDSIHVPPVPVSNRTQVSKMIQGCSASSRFVCFRWPDAQPEMLQYKSASQDSLSHCSEHVRIFLLAPGEITPASKQTNNRYAISSNSLMSSNQQVNDPSVRFNSSSSFSPQWKPCAIGRIPISMNISNQIEFEWTQILCRLTKNIRVSQSTRKIDLVDLALSQLIDQIFGLGNGTHSVHTKVCAPLMLAGREVGVVQLNISFREHLSAHRLAQWVQTVRTCLYIWCERNAPTLPRLPGPPEPSSKFAQKIFRANLNVYVDSIIYNDKFGGESGEKYHVCVMWHTNIYKFSVCAHRLATILQELKLFGCPDIPLLEFKAVDGSLNDRELRKATVQQCFEYVFTSGCAWWLNAPHKLADAFLDACSTTRRIYRLMSIIRRFWVNPRALTALIQVTHTPSRDTSDHRTVSNSKLTFSPMHSDCRTGVGQTMQLETTTEQKRLSSTPRQSVDWNHSNLLSEEEAAEFLNI